jgi:hypothetical protein
MEQIKRGVVVKGIAGDHLAAKLRFEEIERRFRCGLRLQLFAVVGI